MNFKALLVTQDEEATATVGSVLAEFGMVAQVCGYTEAASRLLTESFHLVVADFDHPQAAFECLQKADGAITAALLRDKTKVRTVFGAGASFVLYKPVSPAQAGATLRAAIAILKRERRRAIRVPVQIPVWVRIQSLPEIEGILLDISESGMEVLSERPLIPSGSIGFRFDLSDSIHAEGRAEVAWAKSNGQSGIRFSDLSEQTKVTLRTWIATNAKSGLPEPLEEVSSCRLTDLSLGACYVETESPFPEHSAVALGLRAADMETEAHGVVRVMHPCFGMGIEFALNTPEQRQEVHVFIHLLLSHPGIRPELTVTPFSIPAHADHAAPPSELHDPLVELLQNHEGLSQQDFLLELHRQRSLQISQD
jgi:CheY-like chemotaxis protein